jgi:hypothetical protein
MIEHTFSSPRNRAILKSSAMLFSLIFASVPLFAQGGTPTLHISLGQSQTKIAKAFGEPFGKFRVEDSDDNARVGAPLGLWTVYHLTPFQDRMYVTIVHFRSPGGNSQQSESGKVDALMLEPDGFWTVSQILSDHPGLANVCETSCTVETVVDKSGRISLLLRPKDAQPASTVLFFDGDSATINRKSVSNFQSIASWVYALPLRDFESYHKEFKIEVTGKWLADPKTP